VTDERAARMAMDSGASDPEILRALRAVPRHRFVPDHLQDAAYKDEPLPISSGESTISAPHMVAIQLEAARLVPGLSVLEIGSGSGYLIALIAEMIGPTGRVLGLELDPSLVARSRSILDSLGLRDRAEVRATDGWEGASDRAPFDRILVSCAVPQLAPAWRDQLARDGRIVAPVGDRWVQRLLTFGGGSNPIDTGPECRFVALHRAHYPIYRGPL
jgi:protein-L-isoaspartate(D-aspartate) O-methyltransferase